MRLLPGYKRINRRIVYAEEIIHQPGVASFVRSDIARYTGDLLAEALMSGDVDTTMPIYVDGKQRVDWADFLMNAREVKVSLDYFPRQPDNSREITEGRRAIDG